MFDVLVKNCGRNIQQLSTRTDFLAFWGALIGSNGLTGKYNNLHSTVFMSLHVKNFKVNCALVQYFYSLIPPPSEDWFAAVLSPSISESATTCAPSESTLIVKCKHPRLKF